MLTMLVKGMAWLFAGISSFAITDAAQMEPTRGGLPSLASVPAVAADDAVAGAIVEWRRVSQAGGTLPFYDYANFLLAHPGWPGEEGLRRAAEGALARGGWSPGLAASYFRRFPALTAAGAARQAQALMQVGAKDEAVVAARAAWAMGSLPATDEAVLLGQFSGYLMPEDHDRRMDSLLWAGATASAARQLAYTSPARRQLYAARLAFRTNGPDASNYLNLAGYDGDAGFLADKALWYKLNGAAPTARELLVQRPALSGRPANVEKWYETLLEAAKAAQTEGQYDAAFRIASRVDDALPPGTDVSNQAYGVRDDYTSLVWLAGQVALKQLNRPADAATMFDRYSRASKTPQTQSKGIYWTGRAMAAAGRTTEANAWFGRGTGYGDQFYGQLAIEHLGLPPRQPAAGATRPVDAAARDGFYRRETVRAARYLGSIGDYEGQTAFVRQIAIDAKTDADHALAAQLSTTIGRPDLSVMVGRSALQNGLSDYRAAGYPSVAVPEGHQDQWTLIHAISRQESQFDRAAVSRAGARGLMQLMPGTARETAGKLGLSYDAPALTRDTGYNIQLGSSYIRRMMANYGSYPLAVAAYNAGPGNVNKWLRAYGDPRTGAIDMVDWIEAIPLFETRNYVQRVLENAVVYDLMNPQYSRSQGSARLSWYLGRKPG